MGDGEPAQAYAHKLRAAKKNHKCCECGGAIPVGEKYHYHSGVWDGQGMSFKECVDCASLRECADVDSYPCDCVELGSLYEHVEGCQYHHPEFVISMLAIMRKRGAKIPQWMVEFEATMETKRIQPL